MVGIANRAVLGWHRALVHARFSCGVCGTSLGWHRAHVRARVSCGVCGTMLGWHRGAWSLCVHMSRGV